MAVGFIGFPADLTVRIDGNRVFVRFPANGKGFMRSSFYINIALSPDLPLLLGVVAVAYDG